MTNLEHGPELTTRIAYLESALLAIARFGHAVGCDTSAPVYECCCYDKSQWDIAREALAGTWEAPDA